MSRNLDPEMCQVQVDNLALTHLHSKTKMRLGELMRSGPSQSPPASQNSTPGQTFGAGPSAGIHPANLQLRTFAISQNAPTYPVIIQYKLVSGNRVDLVGMSILMVPLLSGPTFTYEKLFHDVHTLAQTNQFDINTRLLENTGSGRPMELRRLEVKCNLVQGRGDDDFNSPVTNLSELTNVIDTMYRSGQRQIFVAYYEEVTPEKLPG